MNSETKESIRCVVGYSCLLLIAIGTLFGDDIERWRKRTFFPEPDPHRYTAPGFRLEAAGYGYRYSFPFWLKSWPVYPVYSGTYPSRQVAINDTWETYNEHQKLNSKWTPVEP